MVRARGQAGEAERGLWDAWIDAFLWGMLGSMIVDVEGILGLTSVSPADQRRSMSVKESGEARTWREAVVRRRRLIRVVVVVVGKCMVAVGGLLNMESACSFGFASTRMRGWSLNSVLVLRVEKQASIDWTTDERNEEMCLVVRPAKTVLDLLDSAG